MATLETNREDNNVGRGAALKRRNVAEMEMGLVLGLKMESEEKHWGDEERGCWVRRVREGSAREATEEDIVLGFNG